MKWRFYINDVLVHEPRNWNEIATKVGRSDTYWGLEIQASLSEVVFQRVVSATIPNGYNVLKAMFDSLGVNSKATLKIEKWGDSGYFVWALFDFDFSEYSEVYDNDFGTAVKIALISNDLWKRLNNRGTENLIIGDIVGIEGEVVTTVQSEDVLYQSLPLKLESEQETAFGFSYNKDDYRKYLIVQDLLVASANISRYHWIIPITPLKSNMDFVNGTALNKINITNVNNTVTFVDVDTPTPTAITTAGYFKLESFNLLMAETEKDYELNIDYDIVLNAFYSVNANRFINIYEADYDGSNFSNVSLVTQGIHNTLQSPANYTPIDRSFVGTLTFTKQANKVIFMTFSTSNLSIVNMATYDKLNDGGLNSTDINNVQYAQEYGGFTKADITLSSIDTEASSVHTSFSLKNCLTSLLRQIAGKDDVLESPLFSVPPSVSFCYTIDESFNEETTLLKIADIVVPYPCTASFDVLITPPSTEGLTILFTALNDPDTVYAGEIEFVTGVWKTVIAIGVIPQGDISIYAVKESSLEFEIRNICISPIVEKTTFDNIFYTNGKFLRNATTIDNEQPQLTMNFRDLWQTITAQYPLGMDIRNDKYYIDLRSEMFGTDEHTISPTKVEISLVQNMLYTSIKVGNKRVQYEFQNGTEEFNTELEFSTELQAKDKVLDLMTKYNTDYLGIELARRLSFATTATEDTKYDTLNFMSFCELVGQWRTKQYTDISNYPVTVAYNVEFTPKRALIRNSDLLSSALWKIQDSKVRFKKIENLANFESGGVVERADVDYNELENSFYLPIYINAEVGEKDLDNILINRNSIFTFTYRGIEYFGYVWEADIKNGIGNVKLLMRNEE